MAMPCSQRFLLYADALGFKDAILAGVDLGSLASRRKAVFDDLSHLLSAFRVRHVSFSDSLFATPATECASDSELTDLVSFGSRLLARSIENDLPLRGAISTGTLNWRNGDSILGEAVVDAVQWESQLEMIGIVLTPRTMRFVHAEEFTLSSLVADGMLFDPVTTKIPLKGCNTGGVRAGVVCPFWKTKSELSGLVEHLRGLMVQSYDPRVQGLYETTIKLMLDTENSH